MCDRDGALVLLDDAIRNREAKTRSSTNLLGREEWIEDALFVSGWYAWACITKTHLHPIRLRRTRNRNHLACRVGHRFKAYRSSSSKCAQVRNNCCRLADLLHRTVQFLQDVLRVRHAEVDQIDGIA